MNFLDYITENRERLINRQEELQREMAEIEAELRGMKAYEVARAKGQPGRPRGQVTRHPGGTMSVPEAGRHFLGLSESGSWLAWRRGDIPSYKQGRYRRVSVAEMRRHVEERTGEARSRVREEEGYPGSLVMPHE